MGDKVVDHVLLSLHQDDVIEAQAMRIVALEERGRHLEARLETLEKRMDSFWQYMQQRRRY